MRIKKEFGGTINSVSAVLRGREYRIISFALGLLFFGVLYYFLVATIADKSIRLSVMMSGAGLITWSIVNIIVISLLSGILLSMLIFRFRSYQRFGKKGIVGFIGSGIGAFGVGCPTCGAFLFGLIGMPLALMYLPFRGVELQVLGIVVLLASIYLTGKSIKGACKLR